MRFRAVAKRGGSFVITGMTHLDKIERENQTELFKAMRECAVYFDIGMYPPTESIINRVSEICKKENVLLTVTPSVSEFGAALNYHGNTDPGKSFASCPASHCIYLQNGKVSTCAMPQLISIYNAEYNSPIYAGDNDIIDIYEPGLKGIDLIERLKRPMEICRFCDEKRRMYKWMPSPSPDKTDWIGNV